MPDVASLMVFSWVKLYASVNVTAPVYPVIPFNAAATSEELPLNATEASLRVIAPVVALLMAFSWAKVCASDKVAVA